MPVIFPNGNGISILYSNNKNNEDLVANVLFGQPYIFVDDDDVPKDRMFREAWTADFSTPDGFGIGSKQGGAMGEAQDDND